MRDARFYLLRIIFGLVLVGSLSIAITSVLHWFIRALFDVGFRDTDALGLMMSVFGIAFWAMVSTSSLQERSARKLQNWRES